MALDTLPNLRSAVRSWLDDSSISDAQVDEWISLAESLFRRPPETGPGTGLGGIRADRQRLTGTLTTGTRTLSLPSDFLELDRLHLTTTPIELLANVPPDQLDVYRRTGTGRPRFFAILDVIELDIAPDSDYGYELSYWPYWTLSDASPTNWLLTHAPDCYLAGTLFHAARYMRDDEGAAQWAAQYRDAARGANGWYRRSRISRGPVSPRLDIGTP